MTMTTERVGPAAEKGLPWWAAVSLAFGLTVLGGVVDVGLNHGAGVVFDVAYTAGCVAAVCLVRVRGLFGPTAQPPLILAAGLTVAVLLAGPPLTSTSAAVLALVTPLLKTFPMMALATGLTLAIGAFRVLRDRRAFRPAGMVA